jgi:hypothetical protein
VSVAATNDGLARERWFVAGPERVGEHSVEDFAALRVDRKRFGLGDATAAI